MLRYLRSRIGSSYEIKNENLDDFVEFTKLATHGFPQGVLSMCVDERAGFVSVGTKEGRILIYGTHGSQVSGQIEDRLPISFLYPLAGSNILMVLSDCPRTRTQSFFRCQISADRLHFTRVNRDKHLKRITCCEMLANDTNSVLLIGTIIGNIYALRIQNLELSEYIVFLDTALKDIAYLSTQQHKSVDRICVHPEERSQLFILFNSSAVVHYDIANDRVLGMFKAEQSITFMSLGCSPSKLLCSHNDGSYSILDTTVDCAIGEHRRPLTANSNTPIVKIITSRSVNVGEEFVIFSGGMPPDLDDRNIISMFCGDKSLILDFDSAIVDFCIFKENGVALVLCILCAEEFVMVDLCDPLWRMLPFHHLHPIHSSPITFMTAVSGLSEQAHALLTRIAVEQRNSSKIFSRNNWPVRNGLRQSANRRPGPNAKDVQLVLTGHENGILNVWLAIELSFRPWISYNTARDFEGYHDAEMESDGTTSDEAGRDERLDDGLPPLRKAGVYDPFSDDHRLAIQRLDFDVATGEFAVGGRAGQLMVYEGLLKAKTVPSNEVLLLDMTKSESGECTSNGKLRSESAIQTRGKSNDFPAGFCLINSLMVQFKPAVVVTAVAWNHALGVLAAGNEFGYAICSIRTKEVLLINTLMSSSDVIQISDMDGALSRFKSVKKSIRQSFRRKRHQNGETNERERGPPNMRPKEREINQRRINPTAALNGEINAALTRVLYFQTCHLASAVGPPEPHLFVGTHGGVVLIHALRLAPESTTPAPPALNGESQNRGGIFLAAAHANTCPLVREIRLQHQAPIVGIVYNGNRLMVFSEEQIRTFALPGLKPTKYKCRFTALEGSRIRKSAIIQLKSSVRKQRSPEKFIALVTNRGEIYLMAAASNLRNQYRLPFTGPNDSTGILSSTLSNDGQLFYLRPGGSELERCSVSSSTIAVRPRD